MPKTQRRQKLEDFANTFLTVYEDKMKEIDTRELIPFKNTTVEWDEGQGCKWYLRKCVLSDDPTRPCTEYFLNRTYARLTKSITERTVYDECWIYLPSENSYTIKNDSRNAIIGGYYFQGYRGYNPKLIR
jgi:hypothetical protein